MNEIINGTDKEIEDEIERIMYKIHTEGPLLGEDMELLSYCKKFHPLLFAKHEKKLVYLMGLFYKVSEPESVLEEVYAIFAGAIKEESGGKDFTPFQGDAYRRIEEKTYFSFSAPTSAGKSYLFRELIIENKGDIVIMVPSRALIAEYMYKIMSITKDMKGVLLLPFIDNVNISRTERRIYVITPERGVELFKVKNILNITLFLFDEAQISEEKIRGMQFDTFVRRSDEFFPMAKKIFAHPFIENPGAQLEKHSFKDQDSDSRNYNQLSVGKIYLSHLEGNFSYFSPTYPKNKIATEDDVVMGILNTGGTILIYISKNSIYENEYIEKYSKYIEACPKIKDHEAQKYIDRLKDFIGASDDEKEKHSSMMDMMEKGVVIHHGSIPLKARYIIEDFVKGGHAKICFSTATLLQGINMPFDAVWIDNFKFDGVTGGEDGKILSMKNLIGRAGRNRVGPIPIYDYGYVIIDDRNLKTFSQRMEQEVRISPISRLDMEEENMPEDSRDIYDAFRGDGFDDNLYLPKNQIQRIQSADLNDEIEYILDNLLSLNGPIKGSEYQKFTDLKKVKIKDAFKKIYLSHLRRDNLESGEQSVLSVAISLLLWRIQGKTFKEIVWLRHYYTIRGDERKIIEDKRKSGVITSNEALQELGNIKLRFSQPASSLPDKSLKKLYSLFPTESGLKDFNYDKLIYDTYDYLDKVLAFSLANPISAAFHIYFEKTQDVRALMMENYIKFGTNNHNEIMLLRYGFSFEDIEWLEPYIAKIDENEILFKDSVSELSGERYEIIQHYL